MHLAQKLKVTLTVLTAASVLDLILFIVVVCCTLLMVCCAFSRSLQIKYCWDNPASSSSSLSYCEQVSLEQYEIQKMSSSQRALQDLLENIIHDRKMNPRDKKKRLKQVLVYLTTGFEKSLNSFH